MYSFSITLRGCTVPPSDNRFGEGLADLLGQVVELHAAPTRKRDGTLHGILQLAHVARPLVAQELISNLWGDARHLTSHPNCCIQKQYSTIGAW